MDTVLRRPGSRRLALVLWTLLCLLNSSINHVSCTGTYLSLVDYESGTSREHLYRCERRALGKRALFSPAHTIAQLSAHPQNA